MWRDKLKEKIIIDCHIAVQMAIFLNYLNRFSLSTTIPGYGDLIYYD